MIGHVRGVLSTYGSDAITPIVLQPDMVYANLWALCHSYSFRSVIKVVSVFTKRSQTFTLAFLSHWRTLCWVMTGGLGRVGHFGGVGNIRITAMRRVGSGVLLGQ